MQQNKTESTIRDIARRILAERIQVIEAGGDDPAIAEIEEFAAAEFGGNLRLGGEALLSRYQRQVKELKDESSAARAARQAWLNEPEQLALMRELHQAMSDLSEIERRLPNIKANRDLRVKELMKQGVEKAAAEKAASGGNDPEMMHAKATELRVRISQLDRHFA